MAINDDEEIFLFIYLFIICLIPLSTVQNYRVFNARKINECKECGNNYPV
jgi:hypothetical protein